MEEFLETLTVLMDAWKLVSPLEMRGVKDFSLPEDDWLSAVLAVTMDITKLQALGKVELRSSWSVQRAPCRSCSHFTAKLRSRMRSASLAKQMENSAVQA
jgi:hypothetical protein